MTERHNPHSLRMRCIEYFREYFRNSGYRDPDGKFLSEDPHLNRLIEMASDKVLYEAVSENRLAEENPTYAKWLEDRLSKKGNLQSIQC